MVQQQMRFNYWTQLAILLGLVGVCFFLGQLIVVGVSIKATGSSFEAIMKNPEALQTALLQPENASFAQIANITGTFFMFFLPAFMFVYICYRNMLWAGFSKHLNAAQILLAFLIMLFANYMAGPFEELSKKILTHFPSIDKVAAAAEDLYNQTVKSMSNLKGWGQFFIAVFVVAFFPALFEELLFRGVLQNFLTRWLQKPMVAIVITSVVFSLIHASIYLFLSRIILGIALGLVFDYTKNIWVTIMAHFINNFLALSVLFYNNLQGKTVAVNQPEFKLPVWSIFITGAVLYGLFLLLKKVSAANRNRIVLKEEIVFGNQPSIAQQ